MWKDLCWQVWEQPKILNNGVDSTSFNSSSHQDAGLHAQTQTDPMAPCPVTVIHIYLFPQIAGLFHHKSEISIPFSICLNCTSRWVSYSFHFHCAPPIPQSSSLNCHCKQDHARDKPFWLIGTQSLNHTAQLSHACATSPRGQQPPKRSPQICKVKQLF